jgi:hypothetical protein
MKFRVGHKLMAENCEIVMSYWDDTLQVQKS